MWQTRDPSKNERKNDDSIDSAKTNNFSISSGVCAWVFWAFACGERGRSGGAGYGLARRQHGGWERCPFEPHHWHLQFSLWYILAPKPHRRQLLHRCRRGDTLGEHL